MPAPDLLERIDRAIAELQAIRAEVAAFLPAPVEVDDFAPECLLEISTAVEKYNRPADSLRWICRKQGCGVKVAGRWMASPARLERYLNGK